MTSREITVLYFGAAYTATGLHTEIIELPQTEFQQDGEEGTTGFPISKLRNLLNDRHKASGLREVLETSKWSVNLEMIYTEEDAVILRGGEEVAIIPPVSGG